MDAPGLVLSPSATVGRDVRFGAHVVVHDGVVLGDGCVVQDHAVLGKPPARGPHDPGDLAPLVLGEGVRVCTGAIVFAGTTIGDGSIVGDQAYVRERVSLGAATTNDDAMARHPPDEPLQGVVLRRACRVGGGVVLVPGVEVGEEAFVAAGTVVTRDVPPGAVVMGVPARVVRA